MAWQSFGDWLVHKREERELSQGRLATASGIARPYITRMESPGGVKLPTPETRQKLHRVLGTSDDDLVAAGVAIRKEYPGRDGAVVVEYEPAPRPEDTFTPEVLERQAIREIEARYGETTIRDRLHELVDRLTDRQAVAVLTLLEVFEDYAER